ncbi:helix-turn-helix domain-containing protein [Kitasatospora sp. NBC_00240]|uniref:helix-turn-helix domain-containing protein n=1 Tax=Kitasatospora sp. NBC_00240 TaxID=2903567 RepID=UPI002259E2C2|nr:helix-turn-helix transcriptional regulator [Kitasatospora sp. NBC_00240]MCX5214918.1 helix-turn-helix domain-containing protein [Kitasatospora sp. NBC_00240]
MTQRTGTDGAGTPAAAADEEAPADQRDAAAIGARVHRLRRERGLTQRKLAEPAYTAAYVSTLEAGRVKPSEPALRHLAERLGVTYDELATGRPAHLATELRLALTEAHGALAAGDTADAAARFTDCLDRARRHGLPAVQPAALLGLGECALESGRLDQAREHFEEAERLQAGEPLPRRAAAVRGRAVAHLLAGELRYACYLLETAIDRLNESGLHDPDALLLLYSAAIGPYMDMGAHARAAQAAELALALAPGATDPALVAGMHRSVARTLIAEGRTAEADASLAKAQELYQGLRLSADLAKCHWMRGYVHAQAGELDRAESELRTARAMLASRKAALFTDQVEVELADVLRRRGRAAEAGELLGSLLGRIGPERGAVHAAGAHRLLGLIAEELGDTEAAEEHYVNALSLLERAGAAGDLADLCRLLGDLLRRTGRMEAALDVYRTGLGHRAAPGTTTLGPAPAAPPLGLGGSGAAGHP